jgi:hypothetical protein
MPWKKFSCVAGIETPITLVFVMDFLVYVDVNVASLWCFCFGSIFLKPQRGNLFMPSPLLIWYGRGNKTHLKQITFRNYISPEHVPNNGEGSFQWMQQQRERVTIIRGMRAHRHAESRAERWFKLISFIIDFFPTANKHQIDMFTCRKQRSRSKN